MIGPDHRASLEPNELKMMISSIRNIEIALGNGIKKVTKSEAKNIKVARKSVHILTDLKKGAILSQKDLIMKRPGDGISGFEIKYILGRKITLDLRKDHKVSWKDFS
jgi:N,N'-diacetyllegionaminate synthase